MSTAPTSLAPTMPSVWRQYHALTKPRVIQLIVFCALIGMVLAVPGLPSWAQGALPSFLRRPSARATAIQTFCTAMTATSIT